jgi:hypothetical protein
MKTLLTPDLLEHLYGWLAACAAAGRSCPGNREIARRYGFSSGATAAKAVASLEKAGRIRVRRGWTARQATIVATGRSTAPIRDAAGRTRPVARAADTVPVATGRRIAGPKGRQCQWIEGNPSGRDECKCLRPTVPQSSWCPAHLRKVYLPPDVAESRFGPLPQAAGRPPRGRRIA